MPKCTGPKCRKKASQDINKFSKNKAGKYYKMCDECREYYRKMNKKCNRRTVPDKKICDGANCFSDKRLSYFRKAWLCPECLNKDNPVTMNDIMNEKSPTGNAFINF